MSAMNPMVPIRPKWWATGQVRGDKVPSYGRCLYCRDWLHWLYGWPECANPDCGGRA